MSCTTCRTCSTIISGGVGVHRADAGRVLRGQRRDRRHPVDAAAGERLQVRLDARAAAGVRAGDREDGGDRAAHVVQGRRRGVVPQRTAHRGSVCARGRHFFPRERLAARRGKKRRRERQNFPRGSVAPLCGKKRRPQRHFFPRGPICAAVSEERPPSEPTPSPASRSPAAPPPHRLRRPGQAQRTYRPPNPRRTSPSSSSSDSVREAAWASSIERASSASVPCPRSMASSTRRWAGSSGDERRRLRQLLGVGAEHEVEHVARAADDRGAGVQQLVGARGVARGDRAGHRRDHATEVGGEVGGDQRARPGRRLDHDRDGRERGDDAVAGREAPAVAGEAGRHLRHHGPRLDEPRVQAPHPRRIRPSPPRRPARRRAGHPRAAPRAHRRGRPNRSRAPSRRRPAARRR